MESLRKQDEKIKIKVGVRTLRGILEEFPQKIFL